MTDLIKTNTTLGEGAEAKAGQTVIVHCPNVNKFNAAMRYTYYTLRKY